MFEPLPACEVGLVAKRLEGSELLTPGDVLPPRTVGRTVVCVVVCANTSLADSSASKQNEKRRVQRTMLEPSKHSALVENVRTKEGSGFPYRIRCLIRRAKIESSRYVANYSDSEVSSDEASASLSRFASDSWSGCNAST